MYLFKVFTRVKKNIMLLIKFKTSNKLKILKLEKCAYKTFFFSLPCFSDQNKLKQL